MTSLSRSLSRRVLLAGALTAGAVPLLGSLAACGSPTPAQARSSLDRLPATEPGDAPSSVARFTARLADSSWQDRTNLVCSPWSVLVALTMVRNGAAGTTAKEMDATFGVKDLNTFNQQLNTLQQAFAARSRTFPDKREVKLEAANSLWGQQDLAFEKAYLDALAQYYGAGMNLVDFAARTGQAIDMINGWTKDQTHGLIDQIVDDSTITRATQLVLVNTLYLKAPWQKPFNADRTEDGPFTPGGAEPVTVPMMAGSSALWFADDTCEAARIDYLGGELAMAVVLPKRDLSATLGSWAGGGLATLLRSWKPAQVALTMPKWEHEWSADLNATLSQLGMPTAFTDEAEFPGITKETALVISHVVHKTRITVDEEGTEAAAATAVAMEPTSAQVGERHDLKLDRPFLYVIHDVATGTPLFLGVVNNPKE